jgi:Na+/H+-dicarboxylate symporter
LTYWICAAIVLAIVVAVVAPGFAQSFEVGGEIFLRLLKMIVVPLVFTSVLSGVLGLGDVRKLGRPGAAAIGYYLCTTMLAVILGMALVNLVRPGEGAVDRAVLEQYSHLTLGSPKEEIILALSEQTGLSREQVSEVLEDLPSGTAESPSVGMILENLLLMLVSDNLFASAMETQLLPIIVFAILFGAMLTTMGREVTTLTEFIEQANAALMRFVMLLMTIAPIGIFCLVAARFGEAAADERFIAELAQIGWYVATVLTGLFLHALIILPMIFWWVRRENPYRFLLKMSKAVMTAFSTASSSATLPLTMECAEEAGVSRDSTEFVIPLGATINMDGTALYEAVAAIFIAQAIGFDLTLADQAVIALTATLAAIGAAGIPEAGLVTMLIVLNAVGLPVEYVGLILTVDWLLDRFRTAVNILGDSVGAAVVEKAMPNIDRGEA